MGIWTPKSITELSAASNSSSTFNRILGPIDLIMLGIGAVVGAGLFSLTGIVAAENAGPAIVFAFVIAALGCVFSGLCYCELASMIPVAGSAYTYTYAAMGQLMAWMMGWNLILEYAIGAATVSISWSAYIVFLLNGVGFSLPAKWIASPWQAISLQEGEASYGWINLPALFIVIAISFLLIRGIKASSFVNKIIVTVKLLAIFVFVFIGFFYINPDNYHPFIPPNEGEFGKFGFTGILRAAGVLFFAYIGFDAISTAVQEAKKPQRNIPIGILGSLLISTLLYVVFSMVLTGLVNYKHLDVAAPIALALTKIPFSWIGRFIDLAVVAGLTSVVLVMLLGQSRIFYSMARDRLLPHWFSEIHPTFLTPWRSNLIVMCFVGLIGAFAPISAVGHMTSIGTLFAFTIVCVGVLVLRYTQPQTPRPFKVAFGPVIPVLGIIVCVTMMGSLDQEAWLRLLVWQGLGLFIYISYSRKHALGPVKK